MTEERLYVVRCVVCGHKIGETSHADETDDVCDRCESGSS